MQSGVLVDELGLDLVRRAKGHTQVESAQTSERLERQEQALKGLVREERQLQTLVAGK
jgi:hypothetical protein